MLLPDVFKGWKVPGPKPVGGISPSIGETLDPLCGHWGIFQQENGQRYSTDDMLVAWYGAQWCPRAERVLDLGSGISSIALMTAWKLPGTFITTIEAQEQSYKLAQKSVAYNGVQSRFTMINADLRTEGLLDPRARFELIFGNPPYWPLGTALEAENNQARQARLETRGDVSDYCQVATRHLAAGGIFALVFPFNQNERVEKSVQNESLKIIRKRSVFFKEGKPESLSLFIIMKKEDLPPHLQDCTVTDSSVCIRDKNGNITPQFASIKLSLGFPPW